MESGKLETMPKFLFTKITMESLNGIINLIPGIVTLEKFVWKGSQKLESTFFGTGLNINSFDYF